MVTIKQQHLIGGIDHRVHSFAHHRRASGPVRSSDLGDGNEEVADERGIDDGLRRSFRRLVCGAAMAEQLCTATERAWIFFNPPLETTSRFSN